MTESPCDIVLLPGLDGTSVLFRPLLEHLTLAPVLVDYPQTTPSSYGDLLPVVLSALPSQRKYILLGWSFSGPLALMAAAGRPPGLLGVVLCASFIEKPVFYLPTGVQALVRPIMFRFFGHLSRAKALLGGYSTPSLRTLLAEAHAKVPGGVLAERVRAALTVNVETELEECQVPILYLGSTRDYVVPRRNVQRIQRIRPDMRVVSIQGPHLALAVNPAQAATALSEFAQEVSAVCRL